MESAGTKSYGSDFSARYEVADAPFGDAEQFRGLANAQREGRTPIPREPRRPTGSGEHCFQAPPIDEVSAAQAGAWQDSGGAEKANGSLGQLAPDPCDGLGNAQPGTVIVA